MSEESCIFIYNERSKLYLFSTNTELCYLLVINILLIIVIFKKIDYLSTRYIPNDQFFYFNKYL